MKRYAGDPLGNTPRVVVLALQGGQLCSFNAAAARLERTLARIRGLHWQRHYSRLRNKLSLDRLCCSWIQARTIQFVLLQTLNKRRADLGPVDLAINLDSFDLLPKYWPTGCGQVHSRWGLEHELRRSMPWGDQPQQQFLAEPDWDSPTFSTDMRVAQQQLHLRIVLSNGLD